MALNFPQGSALAVSHVFPSILNVPSSVVFSGCSGECYVRGLARGQLPCLLPPLRLQSSLRASGNRTGPRRRRSCEDKGVSTGGWARGGDWAAPPARTGRQAQEPLSRPSALDCDVTRRCPVSAGGFLPALIPGRCARFRELVSTEGPGSPIRGHKPSRSPSGTCLPGACV